jgi:hypothetical protein
MGSKLSARSRIAARAIVIIALCAIVSAALVGCKNNDDNNPTPQARPTEFVAPPVPTLVDPTGVNLTPVSGAIPGYTVSVPPDWTPEPPQAGGEDAYTLHDGARMVAQMTVLCEPPLSRNGRQLEPIDYVNNDVVYIDQVHGTHEEIVPFLIRNTIAAASMRYVTQFGPVTVRQKVVHVVMNQCHWTLRLRVYASGDLTQYDSLFDRVVQSFTTT